MVAITALVAAKLVFGAFEAVQADLSVKKDTTITLPAGIGPDDIVVNPATNRIYVNNVNGASVTVIDGASNTVITNVPVGAGPEDMRLDSATNRVYVANRNSSSVTVIDGATNTNIRTFFAGFNPGRESTGVHSRLAARVLVLILGEMSAFAA